MTGQRNEGRDRSGPGGGGDRSGQLIGGRGRGPGRRRFASACSPISMAPRPRRRRPPSTSGGRRGRGGGRGRRRRRGPAGGQEESTWSGSGSTRLRTTPGCPRSTCCATRCSTTGDGSSASTSGRGPWGAEVAPTACAGRQAGLHRQHGVHRRVVEWRVVHRPLLGHQGGGGVDLGDAGPGAGRRHPDRRERALVRARSTPGSWNPAGPTAQPRCRAPDRDRRVGPAGHPQFVHRSVRAHPGRRSPGDAPATSGSVLGRHHPPR